MFLLSSFAPHVGKRPSGEVWLDSMFCQGSRMPMAHLASCCFSENDVNRYQASSTLCKTYVILMSNVRRSIYSKHWYVYMGGTSLLHVCWDALWVTRFSNVFNIGGNIQISPKPLIRHSTFFLSHPFVFPISSPVHSRVDQFNARPRFYNLNWQYLQYLESLLWLPKTQWLFFFLPAGWGPKLPPVHPN